MAAHRFWRVRGLELNSGLMGGSNLEMRETRGGSNVATDPSKAFASSYYGGGYEPGHMFDPANIDSDWATSGGGSGVQYIGYDFGAGNEKDIVEMAYRARDSGSSDQSAWYVAIEYSDDGTTWTEDYRRYLGTFGGHEVKTFSRPNFTAGANPRRFWRIDVTSAYGSPCGWAEFEFASTVGGDNLSFNCSFTATVSSNYSGSYPFRATFDGTKPPADNQFLFATGGNEWMILDFGDRPVTIAEFKAWARQDFPAQSIRSGSVYYSDDGTTWIRAWDWNFHPFSSGEMQIASQPTTTGHHAWRLLGVQEYAGRSSDGFGLNSLALLDAAGNAIGTPTITASHSDEGGNWALTEAQSPDGGSVGWYSGGSGAAPYVGQWICMAFDTPVSPEFVRFCPLNGFPWTIGRTIAVQYTDDDPASGTAVWRTHYTLRGLVGHTGEARQYRLKNKPTNLVPHRAWRVKADSVGNAGRNCVVAGEIEFLDDAFGWSQVADRPGLPITNSDSNGPKANAFDLNYGNYWHDSCSNGGASWIGWDSGADPTQWFGVGCFAYTARDDNTYAPQDSIKTGGLEYTDDDPTSGTAVWTRAYALLNQLPFAAAERRVLPYIAPPTTDPDGHRYWRIHQWRNFTSQTGIAELEMAQYAGGPNLCTQVGGTASASGTYGGFYGPDRAFNGDRGNGAGEWGVSGGSNAEQWLQFDFGAGNTYVVNEVRVCPFSDNNGTPRIFSLEWSDDGVTWTEHFLCAYDGTYTFGQPTSFVKPAANTHHRFLGLVSVISAGEALYGQSAGSYNDLVGREVEMAETVGGANICGVSAQGHWLPRSDGPASLFDGDFNSEAYNGGGGCKRAMIWYDFGPGNPKAVSEIRYTRGSSYNGNTNRSPGVGFTIYSDDGRGWLKGNDFAGLDWQSGIHSTDMASIPFDPLEGEVIPPPPTRRRAVIIY